MKQRLLEGLFTLYKRGVSPVLHAVGVSRCIFLPTCSEYAYLAMSKYGVVRGAGMALKRIGRCHPLGKGGFDPVP